MPQRLEIHLMRSENFGIFGQPTTGKLGGNFLHENLVKKHNTFWGCFPLQQQPSGRLYA
jgi:hypothetical protein